MAPETEGRPEALIEADIALPEAVATPSTSDMSGLGKAVLIAAAAVSEPASSSASTAGASSVSSTAGSKQGEEYLISVLQ